jgi:hypothetical protein
VCIRETRWHASWRALLDEFRSYTERAEMEGQHVHEMVDRLGDRNSHSMPTVAIA